MGSASLDAHDEPNEQRMPSFDAGFHPRYDIHEPERITFGPQSVPALLVRPVTTRPLPGALLQHGYGVSKAEALPLAARMAAYGFVTLLPDAWGHGERFPATGPTWMTEISVDYFAEVVRHTIDDLGAAIETLCARRDVLPDKLLMGGFSMGAMAALVAGMEDARVGGLVAMAGSPLPDLMELRLFGARPPSDATRAWAAAHDVTQLVGRFAPKPLLISHGRNDDMVPCAGSLRLYEVAQFAYAARPERLALRLYEHTHVISEAQIDDAVNWLAPFFV